MLVARAYTVLDTVVVEISCVHSTDPTGSHLVIREERRGLDGGGVQGLRALSDVADLAALLTVSGDIHGLAGTAGACDL